MSPAAADDVEAPPPHDQATAPPTSSSVATDDLLLCPSSANNNNSADDGGGGGDDTDQTEEEEEGSEGSHNNNNNKDGGDDGDSMENVLVAVQRSEVGASVPTPEEIREMQKGNSSSGRSRSAAAAAARRKQRCYYRSVGWVSLCVLAIAVAALIVSAVRDDNKNSQSSSSSPSPKTPAGDSSTPTGNNDGSRQATPDEIIAFLKENGIETTAYRVTGSPQQMALQWLAEEDEANLPVPTTNDGDDADDDADAYRYLARYVLAVQYHAFDQGVDGGSWTQKHHWLSGRPICDWRGHPDVSDGLGSPGVICNNADDDNNDGPPLELRLKDNSLRGELQTELGLLTSLQVLDLRTNYIQGTLPTELCRLSHLHTLVLSENALTGKVPACLGDKLRDLEWLFLNSNLMTGPLPTEMGRLRYLRGLLLESNLFDGNPLSVLQSLTSLEELFADGNMFQGAIPRDFMVGHHKLVHLDLSHNNFTLEGDFPSHLLQMVNLESLDLSQNALDGHIVAANATLEKNSKLKFLSLHNNTLNGGLSSELQQLVALEHLDVSNNAFHGPLHREMGNWTQLRYLFLSNNHFQAGPIPTELQKLTNLVDFSMRHTNREGPLPTWIATQLPKLVLLDLGKNNFNGTIPEPYGSSSWPKLQYLLLNGNRDLSGTVPRGLGDVLSLTALFLDGTGISGDLDFLCPATVNAELIYADCDDDSGSSSHNSPKATCTSCCECCPHRPGESQGGCSDPYLADMDSSLQEFFHRIDYKFFDPEAAVNGGGGRRRAQ